MASSSADTILNVLQIISDWRGESSTNTDSSRIRAVSNAEISFAQRGFFSEFRLRNRPLTGDGSSDYTIGTSTYPMRKHGLAEVFVGDLTESSRFQVVDFLQYQSLINNNAAERVAYEYYDAATDSWKMHINATPSASETIYYTYYFTPPKKTLTSEIVICPDMDIIAHTALADIYHAEDELQKEQLERQAAEQLISEQMGAENSPAKNQLFSMTAIENQGGRRGFGTY